MDFTKYPNPCSESVAKELDSKEASTSLRNEFTIPTIADLKRNMIAKDTSPGPESSDLSTYLCGNSLGLQPKLTRLYIERYLDTWAAKGVYGHFVELLDAHTEPWMHLDDQAKVEMAKIVGARPSEVAVMETLTANLHLLMASFYRPTKEKYKIIIEGKAFPSDHYAVQSHLAHHGHTPSEAMVVIEPSDSETHYFSTQHICDTIATHAATTALIILPGIHFYTGQFLDIKTITAFAHAKGIPIGWDLAHAAGNVPLHLHDWDVDFAAWCSYKYLNAGPGSIAGLFVHDRHGAVTSDSNSNSNGSSYKPRLSGWWGSSKETRFAMTNEFMPIPGAGGWQLSNPSALDTTSVLASLSIFSCTDMQTLRARSLLLTAYLEHLLVNWPARGGRKKPYVLLTPLDPEERGAQISVRLDAGLLGGVLEELEANGVVVDERKPDVLRVAPTPLYNTFGDVWRFVDVLWRALDTV